MAEVDTSHLNFDALPNLGDVELPQQTNARLIGEHLSNLDKEEPRSFYTDTVFHTTLTADIIKSAGAPDVLPDPSYGPEQFEADLRRAATEEGIQPLFLETLEGAVSTQHMNMLIERAKKQQEIFDSVAQETSDNPWLAWPTLFAVQMLDPAAIAAGAAVAGPAGVAGGFALNVIRGLRNSYRLQKYARVGGAAGLGAIYAGAPEVVRDELGVTPVTTEDYLWALGLGSVIGGTVGALATVNPREARAMAEAGYRTMARAGYNVAGLPKKIRERILKEHVETKQAEAVETQFEVLQEQPPSTASDADPVGTIPHPKYPQIELPVNKDGDIILFRGNHGEKASDSAIYRENKRFFNYTSDLEDARNYSPDLIVLKVPKERIKDIGVRAPDGAPVPGETYFRIPRDLHETAEPYVPPLQADAELVTTPEPEAPSQDIADLGLSLNDVAEQFGVRVPDDLDVDLNVGRAADEATAPRADDTYQMREQAGEVEQLVKRIEATEADLKSPIFVQRFKGADGDEYIVRAHPDALGALDGPYNVFRQGADFKYAKMNKTPLQSIDEVEDFIFNEQSAKRSVTEVAAKDNTANADIDEVKGATASGKPTGAAAEDGGPSGNSSTVGAAQIGTVPELIKDPSFRAFAAQRDEVPRSAVPLGRRIDLTGILGTSRNPIMRALGHAFGTESVGLKTLDGRDVAAPTGAYQEMRRITSAYMASYGQVESAAWQKYLKHNGYADNVVNRNFNDDLKRAFYRDIFEYVRDLYPNKVYPPGVKEVGDEMRRITAEMLKDLQNPGRHVGEVWRPVEGADLIQDNPFYMWRMISHNSVNGAIDAFGIEPMIALFTKAFKQKQPQLSNAQADKLASRYVKSVVGRASGGEDQWSVAFAMGNYGRLRTLLKAAGMDPQDIEDILSQLNLREGDAGRPVNLKRRALLDERAEITVMNRMTGDQHVLKVSDLLVQDANHLFSTYIRRMAGRVAMARIKIPHPHGGLLVDGITSDAEFSALERVARDWYREQRWFEDPTLTKFEGDIPTDFRSLSTSPYELESLRFIRDRTLGVPDPRQTTDYANYMRDIRRFNSMRLMGQVGLAQAGEHAFPAAHLGIRAVIEKVPAFRRVLQGDRKVLTDQFFREIEAMGIGGERLHGFYYNTLDELGDLPFQPPENFSATYKSIQRGLEKGERMVYELSGMSAFQSYQHRAVAHTFIQWFADTSKDMANTGWWNRNDMRRLKQLGIDEQMARRIQDQVSAHSTVENGMLTGRKITRLNLDAWTDLEAKVKLEQGAFRAAHKFIQTNDPTNSAWWMSRPTAQMLLQFRSFPQTAYANQFLYNIHMADPKTVSAFLWSMMWAATMRVVQVHANAIGKGTAAAERYKERYLNTEELAKAAFERSGWSSILPMGIDTLNTLTGGEGVFNSRTSGQPTGAIFGNPLVSAVNQFARGAAGIRRTVQGGPALSESEARQLLGAILPFQNIFGVTNALNLMVSPLPDRAPYKFAR